MDTGTLDTSKGRKRAGPKSLDSDHGGSLDRKTRRRQSSVLSVASTPGLITSGLIKSNSSNDVHRHSPEARSFYELIQATSKLNLGNKSIDTRLKMYPNPNYRGKLSGRGIPVS